jgi:hypothetical protein
VTERHRPTDRPATVVVNQHSCWSEQLERTHTQLLVTVSGPPSYHPTLYCVAMNHTLLLYGRNATEKQRGNRGHSCNRKAPQQYNARDGRSGHQEHTSRHEVFVQRGVLVQGRHSHRRQSIWNRLSSSHVGVVQGSVLYIVRRTWTYLNRVS